MTPWEKVMAMLVGTGGIRGGWRGEGEGGDGEVH